MAGLSALPRKSASLFVPVTPVTNNGFAGATIPDAKRQDVRIMLGYSLNAAASQIIRMPSLEALWRLGKNPGIVRRNLKPRLS